MKKGSIRGIARDTLHFILEVSRDSMPVEFASLLRAEDGVITEVLLLPGTESSSRSALVRLYMLPSMQIVGSVHSHPSGYIRPSEDDILFFARTGDYHIIAGPPFLESSWACFDAAGKRRELPVLDIEPDDDQDLWEA
jgi:proteasome lid subunit RPN8/RPN11